MSIVDKFNIRDNALPKRVSRIARKLNELIDAVTGVNETIRDNAVYSGYGAIGLDVSDSLGTLTAETWYDVPFDTVVLSTPKDVVYDVPNNTMQVQYRGIWDMSVKIEMRFDELNAGRVLRLRLYDITDNAPGAREVGRNASATDISFTVPFEVTDLQVGHVYKLQITSETNFTNATFTGSVWYVKHTSQIDIE